MVVLGKEAGLAVVSALDDVDRQSSSLKAGFARHVRHKKEVKRTHLSR